MVIYLAIALCLTVSWTSASAAEVTSRHRDLDISCGPCRCYVSHKRGVVAKCSNLGLNDIPPLTSELVNYLYLQHNSIKNVYPALENFTNLIYLDLSSNDIAHLHVDSFFNNVKLKVLKLRDNDIPLNVNAYPKGVFRSQKLLVSLDISKNANLDISNMSYPDETLSDLTSLKHLAVDGLKNAVFGPGFSNLTRLTNLTLSGRSGNCIIRHLSNSTFLHVPHIRHLDISKCFLLDIDNSTFRPLRNIDFLNISNNHFLQFDAFGQSLYGLRKSSIRVIDASQIVPTYAIGIELKVKHIFHLNDTKLKHIIFDYNRLELMDSTVPLYFPYLETLSMKGNRFAFGPYLISASPMGNLKKVYADNQYATQPILETVSQTYMVSMKKDLSQLCDKANGKYANPPTMRGRLPSVTGTKELLPNYEEFLNTLNRRSHVFSERCPMADHVLSMMSSEDDYQKLKDKFDDPKFLISLPSNLTYISISGSQLANDIVKLNFSENRIETIDLSNNLFTKWHGPIYPADHLTSLDLSNNYCDYISSVFLQNAYNLVTLNISGNYLSLSLSNDTKGEIFKNLSKLTSLRITHNTISYLPPVIFKDLDSLVSLNLSWNVLSDWSMHIAHMRKLGTLDLSNNRLEYIPEELRHQIDMVTVDRHELLMHVKGNYLQCNCRTLDSLQWMLRGRVNFTDLTETTCQFENRSSVFLTDLEEVVMQMQLHCRTIVPMIIGVVVGVLFFFVVSIAGIVYRYRWKLRYLYYTTRRKYRGYQRLAQDEDNFSYDAFVSYADEDRAFVVEDMQYILERNFGIRLCIHHRDFMVGQAITDNIINAIQSSRKTVVILSPNFLKSSWCKYEVNMAKFESIYSGRNVLCVVWYADLIDNREIPNDLLEEIANDTYLKYPREDAGRPLFWQSLRDAVTQ